MLLSPASHWLKVTSEASSGELFIVVRNEREYKEMKVQRQ